MTARGTRVAGGALMVIAALALSACSGGSGDDAPAGGDGAPAVAPVASEFFVDPDSEVSKQLKEWRDAGRTDDATQLEKIAKEPVATWPTGESGAVEGEVRDITQRAAAAGRKPILVAYNVPNRDCGQYSSGGAGDDGEYRTWLDNFARGMQGSKPVVIVEPDALAQALTACEGQGKTEGREELLKQAVGKLAGAGGEVYIDAGNPGIVTDVGKLADGLRKSGVQDAAGFALNVSNFMTNDEITAYGKKVSDELGGAKYVVDTSRNGSGSYDGPDQPTWCNPPGRSLGTPPTRNTGDEDVAAYLWIKEPGDSDGDCRGAPTAGDFWPQYALDLAKNTR